MNRISLLMVSLSVLFLLDCTTIKRSKTGYRIKGEVTTKVLVDKQLNGASKISGYVYSRNDSTLISIATIQASPNLTTLSDNNGAFSLELAPGKYDIRTNYLGNIQLSTGEFELMPNEHAIIIFELGTSVLY